MSDLRGRTGTDARQTTRRRRERRIDATLEIPFNERVEVECPECEQSHQTSIATSNPASYSPTFGNCPNWDCDAFLKYRFDGTNQEADSPSPTQTGLDQFAGGEAA